MKMLYGLAALIALTALAPAHQACADEMMNAVQFGANGSFIQSHNSADRIYQKSSQQPDRLNHRVLTLDRGFQSVHDTTVRRKTDGSLYASQWNMRIGPNGSYFGSAQINGAQQVQMKSRTHANGGTMSAEGHSQDGRTIQTQMFQRSY